MAAHWTYDIPNPDALFQGDLFRRSDELRALLTEVHPYFAKETKYQHFMLLTQSCDLVIRGGECKAAYLTIAAVRKLSDLLLSKELAKATRGRAIGRVVSKTSEARLREFLQRLVNNNDPNYFFLRADVSQGLGDDFCACLRVTVPLRTEHYELLLKSKTGQLQEVFQAKLGWLVGNNYSRVGTRDWSGAGRELKKLIDSFLLDVRVVEDRKLKRTLKILKEAGETPSDERIIELQDDPRTKVLSRSELFKRAFEAVWPDGAAFADKAHVKAALRDSDALANALKRGLEEGVEGETNGVKNHAELADQLSKSEALHEALGELVDHAWPETTPPARRARFFGRLQNKDDYTEALKEP